MDNERLAAFEAWEGDRPDGLYWPAFAAGWNAAARATSRADLAALRERAEWAESDRDGYGATLRDTLALVDDRDALLNARVLERVAAEARVALLEGLLREAVEGLSFCPICGDGDPNHLPDCRYVAVLAGGGEG